ncbi:GNAT family N-acetyltransferase [Pleurocapsa sp. PCC 7319]|uniref:GNAT family N-acetyltransferase n=1 Tax=Pleurocapsa sp. PCC 7319 TaxID=118161 RepID=UPI00034C0AB9|nr:GNAT family N-acetyltransferase [Pleurocapsa sp. PCC 7319]
MPNSQIAIAKSLPENDVIIAQHFYQLWLDNKVPSDSLREDWLEITLKFIEQARQEFSFQGFIAQDINKNQIVGSASCQLFQGLYPSPFKLEKRKYGYIWNVFVESDYRRQGIATQLTNKTIEYLKNLDCTRAVLHASPWGKPVYENLGFIPGNEMILDLL